MAGNSVRFFCLFYFTMICSLSALQPGKRYDFFCHDGQDIFNAEYVSEDNSRYFVKLSALVTSVPIEKVFVRHIQASRPESTVNKSEYLLTANAGTVAATGRLTGFSGFAPALAFSVRRKLPWQMSAVLRTDALSFRRESMSLTMVGILPGLEYAPSFSAFQFTSAIGLAVGGTYLQGFSESTTVRALIPGAIIYLVMRRNLTTALVLNFSMAASYFHDRLNPLVLPGILVGVEFHL